MKLFIIFFLLFSTSYGNAESIIDDKTGEIIQAPSKVNLLDLKSELKQYVDSLTKVLLDKNTPRDIQIEIINEIKGLSEINGEISLALNQIASKKIDCTKENMNQDCMKDSSLWVKAQTELIRRKHLDFINSKKISQAKNFNFYVNLITDGVVIVAGSILLLISPKGVVVIPLWISRFNVSTKFLKAVGSIIGTYGLSKAGFDLQNYFSVEEEKKLFSFIPVALLRNNIMGEIVQIISSESERERHLGYSLFISNDLDILVNGIVSVIKLEGVSIPIKQSVMRASIHIPNMSDKMKGKVTKVLKDVIDNNENESLRLSAVEALGEVGAGISEILDYLENKAKK